MKARRDLRELTALIVDHLRSCGVYNEADPWILRQSPLGGIGTFAARDIAAGEVIFRDLPIILGPRAVLTTPALCVVCHSASYLKACSKGCGLPVCSNQCENSVLHTNECDVILKWRNNVKFEDWNVKVLECLTPIRSLFLNNFQKRLIKSLQCHTGGEHGFEVDILKKDLSMHISESDEIYMKFLCSVLDANSFEVVVSNGTSESSLRGLYPLGCLANHRCVPNAMHVFDDRHRMVVRAAVFIPKDAEIVHSYTRLIWGTISRRYHLLRTKHFFCCCPRCMDPSEFGTNASALRCTKCDGYVLPKSSAQLETEWECRNCKQTVSQEKIGLMLSILGSWLKECENGDVNTLLTLLNEKILRVVPDSNEISMEVKYKLVWSLGYKEGYLWADLSDEHLEIKEVICLELLDFLNILGAGQCKMRGLLLYEVFCCRREYQVRHIKRKQDSENELKDLLKEAAYILQDDATAPVALKELRDNNITYYENKTNKVEERTIQAVRNKIEHDHENMVTMKAC